MPVLPIELRNKLERTIIEARDVAEAGTKAALEALAVHHHEPYGHMSPEERKLRNHLRSRARQLGDKQNQKGELEITHLVWECAYEQWHCMLFARFLAENDLLIEPKMGVAISLEECEELAKEERKDFWVLASEFAQRMLPQIFRPDDPILKVTFAREHRIKLEQLLDSLESSVFTASDSLGWVYQFWQTKRKKQVNESGNKIGADELPAVTQLFTEPYMVNFLIHNTLGAWHAGKVLTADPSLAKNAESEGEVRKAVALPGVSWEFLRFIKVEVEAASSRLTSDQQMNFFHKDEPIANLTGNLPHWRQEGVTYFVTFRTADSLPQEKLKQWSKEKAEWLTNHPEPHDKVTRREFYERFPARLQEWLDSGYGKCLLSNPELRKIVEKALHHFDGQRYHLDRYVVMPNHVHVLLTPIGEYTLSDILHSWKSFTGNQINQLTGEAGAFWQKESFDHIVRSPAQMEKIREYIRDHSAYSKEAEKRVEEASGLFAKRQDAAITTIWEPEKRQDAASTTIWQAGAEKRQDAASTIWEPAAGVFNGWPKKAAELKVLDPCCGSGHFLVAAFHHLVPLRMAEEGLSAKEACDAVLRDNLHGLEIDERCTQISAFALALAAWRYPGAGSFRKLPPFNIACSGLSASVSKDEWKKLAPDNHNLRIALDWLYDQIQDAPVVGSLLNPAKSDATKIVQWTELSQMLEHVLAQEQSDEEREMGVVAYGLAKAVQLLAGKYHWIITNVPYLARGKQVETLKRFCETHYPTAKNDIATVFLERCLEFCKVEEPSRLFSEKQAAGSRFHSGTVSIVLPQNWLFLTTYRKFREKLLRQDTWHMIARLGEGGFDSAAAAGAFIILLILSRGNRVEEASGLFAKRLETASTIIRGMDVSVPRTAKEKAEMLVTAEIQEVEQKRQLENPDALIKLEGKAANSSLLKSYVSFLQGCSTGDEPRFVRCYWEGCNFSRWKFFQSAPDEGLFSGRNHCWDWPNDRCYLSTYEGARIQGLSAIGKRGFIISGSRRITHSLYLGDYYSKVLASCLSYDQKYDLPLLAYFESGEFEKEVRKIDQKVLVTPGTFEKVPFDLEYWTKVSQEKYPNGLPKPYSDDPTQWIFHGHPARATDKVATASSRCNLQSQDGSVTLQVAMARLLGYRWPAELDEEMELSEEQREWVKKCNALMEHVDQDGIVCIPSVRGEEPAANRLLNLLAAAYESGRGFQPLDNQRQDAAATIAATFLPAIFQDWISKLLAQADCAGETLETWLRDHFLEQHCKLFHHRPFIWHIWDGRRRDGFHALVNYHKLAEANGKGRQLLENLTYSYLGDWISRQKEGVKRGEGGAEDRLAAALELQKRLIAIIEGEKPFDIFVRWKPIEEQPIGWEPDINDGVRINIRSFMARDIPGGQKGSGILRWKPNIKWDKDRGKEPLCPQEQYPWFWKGSQFTGDRVNDIHLSNEEKRQAKEKAKKNK